MADSTRLVIELQTILRGLDKTLRGLDRVKKKLDSIATVQTTRQTGSSRAVADSNKAVVATQRLGQAKKKLDDTDRQAEARRRKEDQAFQQRIRQNENAVKSLQRQRSAALIKQFKDQERAQERARKSILTLDQSLGRVGGSLRNLGLGLTSLGSALSLAFTAPLTALGVIATQNAVTLDSLKRGLVAITGSAAEASVQLKRLTEIAKLPGIGFQEAIQGSIRLQAVGFSAEVAERALIQFSNAVALTGGGRDELNRITVQLGQLSAKGKVLSQDLKPIIEAGPAVGRALKEAFGTVNAEDIQALGLSSEQFLDKLISQLETLPRAAGGARNTLENFADSLFRATASIGDAILPVLTKLINFFEPIITALANGFKSLPPIIQVLIISFGGLAAAAGPTLFILGQFATGIGGLISAFGRLHALGLLPTIAGFRLLQQVMAGTASLAAGQAATTAAAAGGWIALGGAVAIAAGVIVVATLAIVSYVNAQKDAVKISGEQIAATEAQIKALKDQLKFTNSLTEGVERTAAEQDRLARIYADLNTRAKIRITAITDEEKRLVALREELQRVLALRNEERIQQAANLAASLAATAAELRANQKSRDSIADRVRTNTELSQSIRESGRVTVEQSRQLEQLGLSGAATAREAIFALNQANKRLIGTQGDLISSSEKLNGTAEEQATALRLLQQQTGLSTRELLSAAKAMGVFKGNVEATLPTLDRYIAKTDEATKSTDSFNKSLSENERKLNQAGERADEAAKSRQTIIASSAAVARETSVNFEGALKSLRQMVQAVPELRQALERESQLIGKSSEELLVKSLEDAFKGRDKSAAKSGTGLRNAQEQLAKALESVAEASAERQRSIEREKNEDLLQENENQFQLQLIAFEQYIREREFLTRQNIELEIREQEALHTRALAEQERFLARSRKAGVPPAERTRAIAEAVEAEQKAIEAETRIRTLRAEQRRVTVDTNQAIAEAAQQQIKDIRQLDIEFAELRGSIEAALNAQTVERFRERLLALGREQKAVRTQLDTARALGPEETERLQRALKRNQSEIDLIELIKEQEFATNKLTEVNEFVRRAKEEQVELERALAFEVEFRGLKEEDAIKKRLEGERRLADSLAFERDLIQATIDRLEAAKFPVPQSLLDFVRDLNAEIRGLGELPFTEQFRLVEKEFDRLNDQRLLKIAEVERAVRQRDIAEAEGLLLIRRINGQYSADLEQQVELLKQIAAASNDASLQRQAQAAEETVKDANEELVGLGRQLRSTSIDALQTGITDFLASVGDNARTAKEKLLDLVNSVVARINQVIAENLSKKFIESLFGDGTEGTGVLASIGRLFGVGRGEGQVGGVGDVAAAGVTKTVDATAAATALTTGATAAATALAAGGTTAGATLIASMTAAAASFTASIIAAGAAFAATVAASGAAQGLGGLGEAAAAATGLFPSIPGGLVRIVEGGYPEAVLTTDPKHAARQVAILKAFLKETRGLGGRIRGLAAGGFTDHIDIAVPQVSVSSAGLGELAVAGTPSTMRLRQVLVDQRDLGNWVNSSEGEQVLIDFLYRKSSVVRKIGGGK